MKDICTKIIKIFIVLILLLFLIIIVIYIFSKTNNIDEVEERIENEEIEKNYTLYYIPNFKNPEQFLWYKDDLLIVSNDEVFQFDIKNRIYEKVGRIKENEVVGIYDNEVVYMRFENHVITSPEEYATEIEILSEGRDKKIFAKKYHETVKPLKIIEEDLILIDHYFNSPERTYKVKLGNGEIERYDIPEISIQGTEYIKVFKDSKEKFKIPRFNNIIYAKIHSRKNKVALMDEKGYIWLYIRQ